MPPVMPAGYYDRYTDAANYDQHLFLAGPALQSAELNEIQSRSASRLKSVADALFRDGDIVRDAVVIVDPATGNATCSSGAVYLRGAVRGVPSANLTIPLGTVDIGIYLVETVVDAVADPTLKDPASGLLNYQRSGASRLKVEPVWGYSGDGSDGDFFPIYTADDRVLRPKTPPPTIDSVAQAIAKYDRDSTGGSYIVSGMAVTALPDSGPDQVYSVAEGVARANGQDIEFATARRISFDPAPDLKYIANEPHTSTGTGSQRVNVSFTPIANIQSISITRQVTETVTHGAYAGVSDALSHTSVLSIVSVVQGGTTYVANTDYKLTANAVDWSPAGAEPATGSTYQVTYQYIDSAVVPDSQDDTGFNVSGAVTGTLILVSYNQKMPRIDRICLDERGTLVWLKGVATNYNPRAPIVPSNMLGLASIQQTWLASRPVTNDGVKVVPMGDIARLNTRIDYVLGLVAQQRLENSAAVRATGVIKGILTDPFLDDSYRDEGIAQTAAIIDGILTLGIDVTASEVDTRAPGTSSALNHDPVVILSQSARTGSLVINPHNAFPIPTVPPIVVIWPRIHRWTVVTEIFKSRKTRLITDLWRWWQPGKLPGNQRFGNFGGKWSVPDQNTQEALGISTPPASTLEQNTIQFQIDKFSVGETLETLTFDGVTVVPTVSGPADGSGRITGSFVIPANIPAGVKEVVFIGHLGKKCWIKYIADGTTVIDPDTAHHGTDQNVVTPLAETFALDSSQHISAVDLWLTATGTSDVKVQIRSVANGVPTATVLAEAQVAAASISTAGTTRFTFPTPFYATGGVEYAIVVNCDDNTTAVAIAELGKQDPNTQQWVTAQPYQVGVLLTSADGKTWTAQQDRDLSFQLIGPAFNQTTTTIALGTVAVAGASDLAVRASIVRPTDDADVHFILTLPDSSQITVGVDQSVKLDSPITGNVSVQAVLTGTATVSPILLPDVQLLWGVLDGTGTYFSRSIAGGTNIKATVVLEAYLPGSSALEVAYESDGGAYTVLTGPSAVQMDDGWVELTYQSATITNTLMACRLTLTGTSSARPGVRNLRFFSE